MNQRVFQSSAAALLIAAALVACGGGGGGVTPPGGGGGGPTPCPPGFTGTAPNCVAPTTTNASGVLVDDPSNAPLAGVSVKIEPWVAGATPLPSPQTTTAADGTFTLTGVPNGHYLLVIGSDSTSDTVRPTIHDNVTLAGGNQALHAPTLPPIPTITPPAMETNGSYRLMTIDAAKEVPCFNDYKAGRAAHSLSSSQVVDEWLTENAREANTYHGSPSFAPGVPWPGNPWGFLTTGETFAGGGNSCNNTMPPFTDSYSGSSDNQWFAGTWFLANPSNLGSGVGVDEFPRDPRAFTDPNVPVWP